MSPVKKNAYFTLTTVESYCIDSQTNKQKYPSYSFVLFKCGPFWGIKYGWQTKSQRYVEANKQQIKFQPKMSGAVF
jgi:hypothetical protein